MTRPALFTILASVACGAAMAQQANVNLDYDPQRNTENLVPFTAPLNSPDVRDDRTVTFRLRAPEARSVALAGVAVLTALGQEKPVPFQKGEEGIWTLTIGPLRPDMYVYHLLVDGVQMADPNNTVAGFTAMPPYSQLVVHGDGPAYYDARDVPHGTVTRHVYHSAVTNGERELYVYTPPGYDRTQDVPGAVSGRRQWRPAAQLDLRRPRELHDGQPAGGREGRCRWSSPFPTTRWSIATIPGTSSSRSPPSSGSCAST